MAGTHRLLFSQTFTDTASVLATHNLARRDLFVKLLVDGVPRTDLISSIGLTPGEEENEMTVNLASSQTGILQLITADMVAAPLPIAGSLYLEDQTTGEIKKVSLDDGALTVER